MGGYGVVGRSDSSAVSVKIHSVVSVPCILVSRKSPAVAAEPATRESGLIWMFFIGVTSTYQEE